MGSSRLVGHWARLPRFGRWCAVGSRPLCPVGGLQAREWPAKFKKKKLPFFLLPRCVIGGKMMNNVVQNDTVLLFPFFFFFECMKRHRFGENAPFHLNVAPKRAKFQLSPQSPFFLQLHPCQFRSPSLYLAAFFTLVLGL